MLNFMTSKLETDGAIMACLERLAGEDLLTLKEHASTAPSEQTQDLGNNVLRTDEAKVEIFFHFPCIAENQTAYQHRHHLQTVKHGGGGLMMEVHQGEVLMLLYTAIILSTLSPSQRAVCK